MTNIPSKTSKTAEELVAALNKALLAHPECQGIRVLKLTPLENSQGLANWDAEFATEPGNRSPQNASACSSARNRGSRSTLTWLVKADPGSPVEGLAFSVCRRGSTVILMPV